MEGPETGRRLGPDAQIDRATYPKIGEVMFDHGKYEDNHDITRERIAERAQEDYEDNVY